MKFNWQKLSLNQSYLEERFCLGYGILLTLEGNLDPLEHPSSSWVVSISDAMIDNRSLKDCTGQEYRKSPPGEFGPEMAEEDRKTGG